MNPLREGLTEERTPEPLVMVIFGASGDLTARKLFPALYTMAAENRLPQRLAVVGVARRDYDDERFRSLMREGCEAHARSQPVDDTVWEELCRHVHYHRSDLKEPEDYEGLKQAVEAVHQEADIPVENRLYYLSTPPSLFGPIVRGLGDAGMVSYEGEPGMRAIVEKPFGRDLESAERLNAELKEVFAERQIYRIDHYLGKETVQNMLTFRFANGIFEPLWNQHHIEYVQITSAESVGVEGRGGYFEEAGIMRDMVQNHLFQILCLTAMEPPVSLSADAIRNEKVKLLQSLRPIPEGELDEYVVRAQYSAGQVLGESVPGYREEPGVDPDSVTETYVALRVHVGNWRWGKVPFFIRAAKRMPKKVTDIAIKFRDAPFLMFGNNHGQDDAVSNVLTIRIQPDEGITLRFGSKVPGPSMNVAPVNMDFRYGSSFGKEPPEAYERLILDAMLGDKTLFIRDDETEASWRFITRVLEGWAAQDRRRIPTYRAGTWGPTEADELTGRLGKQWRQP